MVFGQIFDFSSKIVCLERVSRFGRSVARASRHSERLIYLKILPRSVRCERLIYRSWRMRVGFTLNALLSTIKRKATIYLYEIVCRRIDKNFSLDLRHNRKVFIFYAFLYALLPTDSFRCAAVNN